MFFIALFFGLLFCGLGVFSFLKVWRTTPEDIAPVFRISIVDRIQARMLASNAENMIQQGRQDQAIHTLLLAIRQDPGNLTNLRKLLDIYRIRSPSVEESRIAINLGNWLLRITNNNPADVNFVADILNTFRRFELTIPLLEQHGSPGSMATRRLLAESYFQVGYFEKTLETIEKASSVNSQDPLLAVYVSAAKVIREKDHEELLKMEQKLSRVEPGTTDYTKAKRAALRAYAATNQSVSFRRIFKELSQSRQLELPDQVIYWHLLQNTELSHLEDLDLSTLPPLTPSEAITASNTLSAIGKINQALEIGKNSVRDFGTESHTVWENYGNMLIRGKHWPELEDLSRSILNHQHNYQLGEVARFWKAIVRIENTAQHDRANSQSRSPIADSSSPEEKFRLACSLLAMDRAKDSELLISSLDGTRSSVEAYWVYRCWLVFRERNLTEFFEVSAKALESNPKSVAHRQNYLAALLSNRSHPKRALELSNELIEETGNRIANRLNYLQALIQNERINQARIELEELNQTPTANPMLIADLRLAAFRIAHAEGANEKLIQIVSSMKKEHYFPSVWEEINRTFNIARVSSQ